MKRSRIFLPALALFAAASIVFAQAPEATPAVKIDLGAKYVGWGSSYSVATPYDGSEILTPLTVSAVPWKGGNFYAQTEFAHGDYTDSFNGSPETFSLSTLSDTVVGLSTNFNSFAVPSILNLAVNIPTGDPTWENKQSNSIVPTEFIDSDYRGRGWGLSAFYGLSLPAGSEQYGAAAGYLYSGAFNPNYGAAPPEQLKLGDSAFLSLNRIADRGNGQTDVLRLSAFFFLPTQIGGADSITMGPNLNASYGWSNPKAFSFEAGVQYFMSAQIVSTGQQASLGTRFYATPSYAFGDLTLAGRVKYVLSNGNPADNPLYFGGGWLAGLEPSYRLKLDSSSDLRFSASFDYVNVSNAGPDSSGNLEDVSYGHWTFGTNYEVSL